jgi:magnesium-transporting ATPase (P-type)
MSFLIFGIGALTSTLLFAIYWFLTRLGFPADLVKTFTFTVFATYTLFLVFSIRSFERSILSYKPFSNRYLVMGALIGGLLTLGSVYLPAARTVFNTVPLSLPWLAAAAGIGVSSIGLVELAKWLFRRHIV